MKAPGPNNPRPFTYANEERARNYVLSMNRRVRGPVYLTVNPVLRTDAKRWPETLRALRYLLPGVEFRVWPQVEKQAKLSPSAVNYIVDNHAGNILIGRRKQGMLKIGSVGLAESSAFAGAGKPVFVFTGQRLIAWPDCQVLKIPRGKRKDPRTAAYVLLPVRPPAGKPLPTLAASLHTLGIREPGVIARAAGFIPERPAGAPPERGTYGGARMVTNIKPHSEAL